MKMTIPVRLRPLELRPGHPLEARAHLARRRPLNYRARLEAAWRAVWLLRWAFLFVAVLSSAATLTILRLAE